MKTRKYLLLSLILLLCGIISIPAEARTISKTEAETAVDGWLNANFMPMDAAIGWQIEWTDTYNDANGIPAYYIVYLQPAGFVIVAADDLVEPIIGFVTGYLYYDPSPDNVLGAMVSRDLPARIKTAETIEQKLTLNSQGTSQRFTSKEIISRIGSLKAKIKWRQLQTAAFVPPTGALTVSDVRVPALLGSTWGQDNVAGSYCYNYYTPNHYYDGCVATAMAQLMRYWQWPMTGIGVKSSSIRVGSTTTTASTRGGNGAGGAYLWNQMPLTPDSSLTTAQRQAIGALCYDAGVAAHMQYGSGGSGAYMHDARYALVSTFKYTNAVMGGNEYSDIGAGLTDMINPNLDAGCPVLLAIYRYVNNQYTAGHAIVADGYGYNAATLYHHLNLGWDGAADAWYNLPNVDTGYYNFNIVVACIYNIYTSGTGEIISGRVTHSSGVAFPGVTVTAAGPGVTYSAVTNDYGIYALAKVLPNTTYTVSASAPGCTFGDKVVTTGYSLTGQLTSGNKGGIDFVTDSAIPAAPAAPATLTYPASSGTGRYTVTWDAPAGATAYELIRSLDGGASWRQVYLGSGTSYSESVVNGSYRYWVRAINGGGSSDWTTGAASCVVNTTPPGTPSSITYPASSSTGRYTISWGSGSGATSYQLKRSRNNSTTWTVIYTGTARSYSENVTTNGSYKYSVKAINAAGSSAWRTKTTGCLVYRRYYI